MGQIVSTAARPKRCNINKLSQLGTPAAGEHILVSSDNSMNAAGQGNFDCYIVGDGTTAATALVLHKINKISDEYDVANALGLLSEKTIVYDTSGIAAGGYYDANGNYITNGYAYSSDLIDCANYTKLYYTGMLKWVIGCLFYDANNNIIGTDLIGNNQNQNLTNKEVDIPSDAKKVRVQWYSASKGLSFLEQIIYDIAGTDDEIKAELSELTNEDYRDYIFPTIDGSYVNENGVLTESTLYTTTGWMNVSGLSKVLYSGHVKWAVMYAVLMKDSGGVIHKYINGTTTETTYTEEEIPVPNKDIVEVAFNFLKSGGAQDRYVIEIGSRFVGVNEKANFQTHASEKWLVVGDSLTQINASSTKRYYEYVNERLAYQIVNNASGGVGYARQGTDGNTFANQINNAPSDISLITIFGSGNDMGAGLPVGSASDTGTDSLAGYINATIDAVRAKFPTIPFGIITPTPWVHYEPSDTGTTASKFQAYAAVIVEICARRGVPCLDLYHCSNLYPDSIEFRALAFKRDGIWKKVTDTSTISDEWVLITSENIAEYQALCDDQLAVGDYVENSGGVHPDEVGHAIIAPRFKEFINSLIL